MASMDESTESTASTVEGKRWNLRRRKSPTQAVDQSLTTETEDDDVSQEADATVSTASASEMSTPPPPPPTAPPQPPSRKRKAAEPKGPKTKTPARKRPRKSTEPTGLDQPPQTPGEQLYEVVVGGRGALSNIASEWVSRYQQDAEAAMVELIQYFVLCSGCKASVSVRMFQTEAPSDVIRALTENFSEDSGDYPLSLTGSVHRKFRANFTEFIERVVTQCQHGILYDEYMLDTLIAWLVGFTDSQVRAFRHTCTLACVKLVSALVSVANTVTIELDNTQRQIDAERKRQQAKKGAPGKLAKLLTKNGELQNNIGELEETMKAVFSSVFVHRYRDVRSEIRAVCISELGAWMLNYSATFLADSYLKYLGWTLNDKVGEVRLACVQVLESLYSSEEAAPHLELFTQKFKERIVSMRLDCEEGVGVHAIHLSSHLLTLDMLEPEDCVEICELVFFENRAISHAAGEFAASYLFSDDFMAKARQARAPKGRKKPTDSQIKLRELVRFFIDVKIHDHATYFVDSLWDHTAVLRDWEAMVSMLQDNSCGIALTDEEEGVLVEIMTCAARKASGVHPPAGRGRGKLLSNKEKRAFEEAKGSFSTSLMVALPDLISKYGTETAQAANLACLPQHFDLEVYAEHRLQKHLEGLLTHLQQLTLKHLDTAVLEECAKTYRYLCDTDFSLLSTTEVAFNQLVDELVQNLQYYLKECQDQPLAEETEEVVGLQAALKRVVAIYKVRDVTRWGFTADLSQLLDSCLSGEAHEGVVCCLVECLTVSLLWAVQALDESNPEREVMRQVRQKLVTLVTQSHELLRFSQSDEVKREAYTTLCDLLVTFARQLQRVGQLGALVYTADSSLQQSLQEYVLENVVSLDEELEVEPQSEEEALAQAERLNDRRVLLTGFLKLAMFGAIEMKFVAPVFGQYITQYHNFGDLIKMAVSRCREASPLAWYRTVVLCMQQLYQSHVEEMGGVDQHSPEWADLKDLARKIALSFGFERYDITKTRQPLMGIHRDGVQFALSRPDDEDTDPTSPPPNLEFLVVLSEFSFRLLDVDRTGTNGILTYLRGLLPEGVWEQLDDLGGWEPLRVYRNTLVKDHTATDSHNQSKTAKGKGKTPAKGKRKAPPKPDADGWLNSRPQKTPRQESPEALRSDGASESPEGSPPEAQDTQISWMGTQKPEGKGMRTRRSYVRRELNLSTASSTA